MGSQQTSSASGGKIRVGIDDVPFGICQIAVAFRAAIASVPQIGRKRVGRLALRRQLASATRLDIDDR